MVAGGSQNFSIEGKREIWSSDSCTAQYRFLVPKTDWWSKLGVHIKLYVSVASVWRFSVGNIRPFLNWNASMAAEGILRFLHGFPFPLHHQGSDSWSLLSIVWWILGGYLGGYLVSAYSNTSINKIARKLLYKEVLSKCRLPELLLPFPWVPSWQCGC